LAALFHVLFHAEEAKKIVGCCVGDPWNVNALISARATDNCHIENNFDLDALAAAIKTADKSKHVVVIDSNGLVSTASVRFKACSTSLVSSRFLAAQAALSFPLCHL